MWPLHHNCQIDHTPLLLQPPLFIDHIISVGVISGDIRMPKTCDGRYDVFALKTKVTVRQVPLVPPRLHNLQFMIQICGTAVKLGRGPVELKITLGRNVNISVRLANFPLVVMLAFRRLESREGGRMLVMVGGRRISGGNTYTHVHIH